MSIGKFAPILFAAAGVAAGFLLGNQARQGAASPALNEARAAEAKYAKATEATAASASLHMLQSPAARATNRIETDYGLGDGHISKLLPYPKGGPGVRTPFDLWRYGGRGDNSWNTPALPVVTSVAVSVPPLRFSVPTVPLFWLI